MTIAYDTTLVVDVGAESAADAVLISGASDWREYQFGVGIGTAAAVVAEWSATGAGRWVPAAPARVTSGTIQFRGVYPYLRIRWAGNTGTLTVDMVRSDDRQVL